MMCNYLVICCYSVVILLLFCWYFVVIFLFCYFAILLFCYFVILLFCYFVILFTEDTARTEMDSNSTECHHTSLPSTYHTFSIRRERGGKRQKERRNRKKERDRAEGRGIKTYHCTPLAMESRKLKSRGVKEASISSPMLGTSQSVY